MSDDKPIRIVGRTQILKTPYVWNDDGKSIRLMTEEEIAISALTQPEDGHLADKPGEKRHDEYDTDRRG